MYPASQLFHDAVRNGNEQKALLIFSDCVFTNEDINVSNGIEFNDYFNTETDLAIGQTPSNEITFSLFNDKRLLNEYEFGDFTATLGVLIDTGTYQHRRSVTIVTDNATYIGGASSPYLTRNGTAVASQPSFAVHSMLAYGGKVCVFGMNGECKAYNDSDGSAIVNFAINSFMQDKVKRWTGNGYVYRKKTVSGVNTQVLEAYNGGILKTYEFVPLGMFTAERPDVPDVIQLNMNCHDFMMKFEKDMPTAEELNMSYPSSISNLFTKLCAKVGVTPLSTTFINSSAMIAEEPEEFANATMRTVLKWIAEAAGSNLRFNRDGKLVFDWIRTTAQSYDANGYSEFSPKWFQTKQITKLYNKSFQEEEDTEAGSGTEEYLIQDNPLLRGVISNG